MSESSMQHYRDQVVAVAVRQSRIVCAECGRRCANGDCITRLHQRFALWPMCCRQPATCSHDGLPWLDADL